MGLDTAISTMQGLAAQYPYLALALILFTAGFFIRGRWGVVVGALGMYALLQQFGLVDTFVELFKSAFSFIGEKLGGVM